MQRAILDQQGAACVGHWSLFCCSFVIVRGVAKALKDPGRRPIHTDMCNICIGYFVSIGAHLNKLCCSLINILLSSSDHTGSIWLVCISVLEPLAVLDCLEKMGERRHKREKGWFQSSQFPTGHCRHPVLQWGLFPIHCCHSQGDESAALNSPVSPVPSSRLNWSLPWTHLCRNWQGSVQSTLGNDIFAAYLMLCTKNFSFGTWWRMMGSFG